MVLRACQQQSSSSIKVMRFVMSPQNVQLASGCIIRNHGPRLGCLPLELCSLEPATSWAVERVSLTWQISDHLHSCCNFLCRSQSHESRADCSCLQRLHCCPMSAMEKAHMLGNPLMSWSKTPKLHTGQSVFRAEGWAWSMH